MIDKLKLKRYKHNNPYQLSWLQKEHHLLVNEQSLVSLKIDNYNDKTLCDVMPIDACDLLLGRLCPFDRQAAHNGWIKYLLNKDGKVYTLNLLKSREEESEDNLKVCLGFGKTFMKELRREGMLYNCSEACNKWDNDEGWRRSANG